MAQQPPLKVLTELIVDEPDSVAQDILEGSDESKSVAILEASGQSQLEIPVDKEAEMQACFENATKKAMHIPSGYRKVAVLIIRWRHDIDDERDREGHSNEIKRLKEVFEGRMNYACSEVDLHTEHKPQHILNEAIATHIRNNNDPNNLLIVYYTGHGVIVGEEPHERLSMSAKGNSEPSEGPHSATAEWDDAETQLLSKSMDADVLAILDCCYAGGAHKGLPRNTRTYELLAACSKDDKTPAPGPNSFTSRLLDAIEESLNAPESSPMVTTRLIAMVNRKKRRSSAPSEQHDRLSRHDGHVQLAPVQQFTPQEDETTKSKPTPEKAVVQLRISLAQSQLNPDQVKDWGEELIKASLKVNMPVLRIDWLKVRVDRPKVRNFRQAVLLCVQNNSRKRKFVTTHLETHGNPSFQKKRAQDSLDPSDLCDTSPMTPVSDANN